MSSATSDTKEVPQELIQVHLIHFNNYLVEFIQKIQSTLPESSPVRRTFAKYYKYYRKFVKEDRRLEFIGEFVEHLSKYSKEFTTNDEMLFSDEKEYYPGQPVYLLKGIDFKLLWHEESLTDTTKASIWKYLQTLYIVATHILKETHRMERLLRRQKEIIENLVKSLQLEQQIKTDAEEMDKMDEEERKKLLSQGFDLKHIFGEDNSITALASELVKELKLEESGSLGPMELIGMITGQNGAKMNDLISRVTARLQDKIKKGDLDEKQLLDDAKNMSERLKGKFGNIPGVDELSKKLAEKLSADKGSEGSTDDVSGQMDELKGIFEQLGLSGLGNFEEQIKSMMASFAGGNVSAKEADTEDAELEAMKRQVKDS